MNHRKTGSSMPPGACLSLRWGREDGRTALSGPYDRPGAVAAVPDPHESPESPESGTNGPVPSQTSLQSPENPAVEAVRTPSPYLYPSGKPALGCPRNTPDKTPALDGDPLQPLNFNPENPNPQRPYGPPLLQGDRHAPESVIGLSELVIGIVGIRKSPDGGRSFQDTAGQGVPHRPYGPRGCRAAGRHAKRLLAHPPISVAADRGNWDWGSEPKRDDQSLRDSA